MKLSKNKVSSNTNNKEINSLEEDVKIDSETDTKEKKVDDDEDIRLKTVEKRIKKSKNLKINY